MQRSQVGSSLDEWICCKQEYWRPHFQLALLNYKNGKCCPLIAHQPTIDTNRRVRYLIWVEIQQQHLVKKDLLWHTRRGEGVHFPRESTGFTKFWKLDIQACNRGITTTASYYLYYMQSFHKVRRAGIWHNEFWNNLMEIVWISTRPDKYCAQSMRGRWWNMYFK